jgi:anthranilate phosphoribosyltransferase
MIREAIDKLVKRIDLSEADMRGSFGEIMSGSCADAQIAAFLTALRMKGETVAEITAAAGVMRDKSVRIDAGKNLVDTCGTGGSGINTFNISTAASLVAAGCGLKVAKHGNRAASSRCGSADVLEALGVKIDVAPDMVQRCIMEIGIGFMYAPLFHSAMKYASNARREIGMRTIFNILGPLSNPAGALSQVIGVCDASLTGKMARVLKGLGSKRAFVVCGSDRLDEITITGKTKVAELKDGRIREYYISPSQFGIGRASLDDIEGGDAKENAGMIMSVLKGETGARRDIVLLNAAAAIVAGNKASDIKSGIKVAAQSIDSGTALNKLVSLVEMTNR